MAFGSIPAAHHVRASNLEACRSSKLCTQHKYFATSIACDVGVSRLTTRLRRQRLPFLSLTAPEFKSSRLYHQADFAFCIVFCCATSDPI